MALTKQRPWRVLVAASAAEGLVLAERERPDVVLLDVSMPGTDGPALYSELRRLPSMETTPVIFVTAHAMPRHTTKLVALGARGVITKPFVAKNLADQIEQILARRDTRPLAPSDAAPPAANAGAADA